MQSRYLVCMEVFQEFPITLFEINDTKMWLSGTKRKIKTDFGEKEISVENTFRAIFTLFSTSFPQLFYPLMTRQFFCDFHEKSEDFCVS